jgi:fructose-1,6-bisphosphatase I
MTMPGPLGAGEFVITHPQVQIPPRHPIYSINEGNSVNWDPATKK